MDAEPATVNEPLRPVGADAMLRTSSLDLGGWFAIGATVLAFHLLGVHYVDAFYANNPPHYDSVGSYTMMFEIVTQAESGDWAGAAVHAADSFLSWLQSFFALLAAPVLDTRPAGVQLLNSVAMGALVASLYTCARAAGTGRFRAYLLSLIAFTPDAFYDWWGGALDMRRDFAFVAFLSASLFSLLSLHWRPNRGTSLWFGLCTALTVASRDNAFVFVFAMIAIPAAALALHGRFKRAPRVLRRYVPAVWSALPVLLPWSVAVLPLALQRRMDPFSMYGTGGDPWVALELYWHYPFALMGGRMGELPQLPMADWTPLATPDPLVASVVPQLGRLAGGVHGTLPLTVALSSVLLCSVLLSLLTGITKLQGHVRGALCTLLGLWCYGVTVFIICVIAGLRPMAFTTAQIPFFPALTGFMLIIFGFGLVVVRGSRRIAKRWQTGMCVLACATVLFRSIVAIEAKAPEPTRRFVEAGQRLTDILLAAPGDVTVAFLWHEGINFDTSAYYAAQRGEPRRLHQLRYHHEGHQLDLQAGVPEGADPDAMLAAVTKALRAARFVIVSTKPGRYADADSPFLIFRHGQPLVDAVLASPQYQETMRFTVWGDEIVVLKLVGSDPLLPTSIGHW